MTTLTDLTPRELDVAEGCGRRWTVKRIAAAMEISERRVRVLIAVVAVKIGVEDGCDDRLMVGDWWLRATPDRMTDRVA